MITTTLYGFKKPEDSDVADLRIFVGDNMDLIESTINGLEVKTVDWLDITGKPATFPSTAHTHLWADITDKPSTFTPSLHTHTWTEIQSKPTTFVPSSHTHLWVDITDKPTTFAPKLMSGTVIGGAKKGNGLNMSGEYLYVETGTGIVITGNNAVGIDTNYFGTNYASKSHTHLWNDITNKPTTFTPSAHTHLWADVTDKPISFTPSIHSHLWNDITDKPISFTPPLASTSAVGGIIVGNGLGISDGYLYINAGTGLRVDDTSTLVIADNVNIKDNYGSNANATNSAFRAYTNVATPFPAWAITKILFNNIEFDVLGEYSLTNNRFQPYAKGIYMVSIGFRIGGIDSPQLFISIYKNGVEYTRLQNLVNGAYGANTAFQVHGCAVVKLVAGDYLEVFGYSTKAGDIQASAGATFFSAVKIS